jgi:RNA polymerase sigma factor (sigma-70 family)
LFPVFRCGGNISVETMSEPDSRLIAEFNARRSEDAFAALVRQHINLVFATAMRQVGDAGAAEEITQNVFVALAQAAGKLGSHPTIAGWLHQTALNKSREWLRGELRRRKREQIAVNLDLVRAEGDSVWSPLVPLLDEALLELREPDRLAVILHFMEGRTFHEVGSALGVGEDTARKRVHRCLDQLTDFFRRRGFAVPALAAGTPLFALSSHAAPAGLAASATTAGLAAAHSATTSTLTLIKGALKIMAWTKAKTAIVAGAAVILAAGTVTPIVIHHLQAKDSVFSWKRELSGADNAAYQRQTGTTPAQAARAFLEATSSGDWAEVVKYWDPEFFKKHPEDLETHKNFYGGMELISLGKPFKGRVRGDRGAYYGVFVPYEIRLKDGSVKKWQLAIECSNPEHHWYFDGGM